MNALLRTISEDNNKAEIGTIREVMINKVTDKFVSGYADNMKNVIVNDASRQGRDVKLGDFVKIEITSVEPMKLFGRLLS